ncbi:RIO1 family regulatory kinase/ATPase, partial [Armatimonas sp.]|uniref:protein kinase domain-containing protein n=1 Tax=Armatimonas sp. TaxID=1872638 RepID=UPI00375350BC
MAHELEGTTVLGRYAVGKCLSEKGGYALTYEAVDTDKPSHPPCVVKHLRDDKHDSLSRELFEREGKALEHLTGKGPFPKLEATRGDFHVMEFLPGATLNTEDTHSEQEARKLLIELLEILVILDQVGLIHRDIKPLNLIRHKVSGKLYLIDFGMVRDKNKALDKLKDGTIAPGSQGFSAPEQFNGEASVKSDLYAVGRVVLNFWFGMPAERNWHSPLGADQRLVQVLKVMTAFLPESRTITATQALQQLRQPTLPVTPPPVTTSRSEAPTRQATSPSPRPEPVIERPTTRPSVPQETKVEEKPKPKASQGPTPGVPGWVWGLGATALAVGAGVFPPGWAFVKSLMPTPPVANRKLPSSYPAPKTLAEYKAQMMAIPGGSFARG